MSYEGHIQFICSQGHYNEHDCYFEKKCDCGSDTIWSNQVDDTNGDAFGIIPNFILDRFIASPVKIETCNLGHVHTVQKAIYNIPTDTETLRHYWDYQKGMFVPLAMLPKD